MRWMDIYRRVRLKFVSRRNKVYLTDGVVEKHFVSEEAANFEAAQLNRLRENGLDVPLVFECQKAVLKMEYFTGEVLPDFIDRLESLDKYDPCEIEAAATGIIKWLREYYLAVNTDLTGEIRGDVNGRNFLIEGGLCRGIDFEERIFGPKEQDIGRLIAYTLTYDPQGTKIKALLAEKLLSSAVSMLGVSEQEVLRHRELEFEAMAERRKKHHNT